jgi:hypothetical protein
MITVDELTIWLLFISATFFLISLGVLLYACALLLDLRHKIKTFDWRAPTHSNGYKIRERH